MALADRGNMAKVSTTAEDCQLNGAHYFDEFPSDAVVHAFGKVLKPDFSGSLQCVLYNCFPAVGRFRSGCAIHT